MPQGLGNKMIPPRRGLDKRPEDALIRRASGLHDRWAARDFVSPRFNRLQSIWGGCPQRSEGKKQVVCLHKANAGKIVDFEI
jgi:hypothetical protein